MKFTLSWLKDFLITEASLTEITEALTSLGLEVEGVQDRAESLKPFIVAEILQAEPHPQADKLRVCKVNNGTETLQIVCGAPNARAGIKVALAPIGAVIPTNGMTIKAAEVRGVKSNGMLCSAAELGLGADGAGILELPESAVPGENFAASMGYDDPVIEIAITPNRGDCLGVYGIARDLAAKGLGTLKPLTIKDIKENGKSSIQVKLETKGKFLGRYFHNVTNGESPAWMKARLEAIGAKPISALVDITNYLSFTYGRPAHVFDAAKIGKTLTLRESRAGEAFTALDGKAYTLKAGHAVIADEKGVQALGGIMGGAESAVSPQTTEVFLEIAWFDPLMIAQAGRAYQIDSDARYRFERTVDPGFLETGMALASQWILELCGGEASEVVSAGSVPKNAAPIAFEPSDVEAIIGTSIPSDNCYTTLKDVGFIIEEKQVTPPSFRPDITIKQDVVEEIIRVHGYEHIPITKLPELQQPTITPEQQKRFITRRLLAGRGLSEAVTYSFISHEDAQGFAATNQKLAKLQNPISTDLSTLRPSILPHLLRAVAGNAARSLKANRLFEVGPVFTGISPGEQEMVAGGVRSGEATAQTPHGKARNVDLFDAKADALAALSPYIETGNLMVSREVPGYYHPGRSGTLKLGPNLLGYFGELHPSLLKKFDIGEPVVTFEVFLDRAPKSKGVKKTQRPAFQPSNLQPVDRDFAFIMDAANPATDIVKAAKKADKALISQVQLFDIFEGGSVPQGKKSVAITVRLQPQKETLKDEEIEKVAQNVIAEVMKIGGTLRV